MSVDAPAGSAPSALKDALSPATAFGLAAAGVATVGPLSVSVMAVVNVPLDRLPSSAMTLNVSEAALPDAVYVKVASAAFNCDKLPLRVSAALPSAPVTMAAPPPVLTLRLPVPTCKTSCSELKMP